jgi:hypothetical protein
MKILLLILFLSLQFNILYSQELIFDSNLPKIILHAKTDFISEQSESGTNIATKTNSTGTHDNEISDSTRKESKIESVWEANGRFFVKVSLLENETPIELKMFNMLGKLVTQIYKGEANDGDVFDFEADLQNGIYICVMTGPKIRDAEKFILSR